MIGKERVGAFYFEHNNLGVAIFNAETMRIQCSRINSLCRLLHPQLAAIAHPCTSILTNTPNHDIFA
jgi:DNA mismatch repair protein MSH5